MHASKRSTLLRVAEELEALWADVRFYWRLLDSCDRMAFGCALLMLFGLFAPWLSAPGLLTQIGLMGGGDFHFFLSITTLFLTQKVIEYKKDPLWALQECPPPLLRVSLFYLLIGLLSTLSIIAFLFYYGSQYRIISQNLDIRYGFYITFAGGAGIMMAGLSRFHKSP